MEISSPVLADFMLALLPCTLGIKSPLPLSSQQMDNPTDLFYFFFSQEIPPLALPGLYLSEWGFRSHWGKQEKKISLQGKERIISLICICNSSSSILIEDFEHHHGMPILASFFSERWSSWQHLLTTNTTEINSYVLIGLAILQKCA